MEHKFKIGDTLEIIKSGYGLGAEHIGKTCKVTSLGVYGYKPGYSIYPFLGNCETGYLNGMIGENSFKLVSAAELYKIY